MSAVLTSELLENMEVVGFGYESDGRDSEAKELGSKSEAGAVAEPKEDGYQTASTRWEKVQAKFEKRVLSDFRYQMQTENQERVAFVDMEFMEKSWFVWTVLEGEEDDPGRRSTSKREKMRTR